MAICLKTIRVDKRVFLGEKKDDRERRGRRGRPRETEGERSARFCLMFMDMSSENTILLWRGSMLSLSLFLTNPLYMHDIAKLASLLFDTFWFSLPLCIFHQIKPPVLSQSCSSAFHLPLTVWHSIVIDSKCIFAFCKISKKKFKWFLIRFEWFWILNMLFYITATIEIKVISQMLQ